MTRCFGTVFKRPLFKKEEKREETKQKESAGRHRTFSFFFTIYYGPPWKMDDLSALTGQYKSSGSAGDSQLILADDDTITKEHIEYLELYFVFIYKYLSAVFYLFLSVATAAAASCLCKWPDE